MLENYRHVSDSLFKLPDGLTNVNPKGSVVANKEIDCLLKSLKYEIEKQSNHAEFNQFDAVLYKSLLVNGISYFVKVHVGNNKFIHVKLYKPFLFQNKSITNGLRAACAGVQLEKKFDDEIEFF